MGFCRRCGDIVTGPRCKCGGSAVAPVVNWTAGEDGSKQDRWSKTYMTKDTPDPNTTPIQPLHTGINNRRFPRPTGSGQSFSDMSSRVSAHIASATASRPTSPLKSAHTGLGSQSDETNAEEGILPSPHNSELAKVYGSVLQPKETLASFACALCSTPFSPDATIYPDPSNVSASGIDNSSSQGGTRFLCRPCFTMNGGSKGDCHRCHRPVLILKSEGGFVENSSRVWHKKCFNCNGCGTNIGDHPMVDLLGLPSCADCFDSCLKRPARDDIFGSPPGTDSTTPLHTLGGNRKDTKVVEREGSPALDELEARLGIVRNSQSAVSSSPPVGRLPRTSFTTSYKEPSTKSQIPSDRPRANSTASSTVYPSRRRHDSFDSFGSPSPSRTAHRAKPAAYTGDETDSSGSPRVCTPRNSVGEASKQPTEEAIEEMKRRFLSGNGSPAVTPQKTTGSNTSTTRRRSRSRSRSRPRASLNADSASLNATPVIPTVIRDEDRMSTVVSPARALRPSASTSSLRLLRSHRTGETETSVGLDTDIGVESERDLYTILPDRTGESTQPLRIRRNHTGGTGTASLSRDTTGTTNYLSEHRTGDTVYMTANDTGGTYRTERLDSQKTGDVLTSHRTGESIVHQTSGQAEYIKKQQTGEGVTRQHTGEKRIRRQRTGEAEVRIHDTGTVEHPPIRKQKTGEGRVRRQRTGDSDISSTLSSTTRNSSMIEPAPAGYILRRDRTGDAEVESLLGPIASLGTGDLIDLSPSPEPPSSLSRIPLRVGVRALGRASDYRSGLDFGFRTSSASTSSVASSGYESSASSIPDLASDFSDTTSTRSAGPSTPPSISPPSRSTTKTTSRYGSGPRNVTPTPRSRSKTVGHSGAATPNPSKDEVCERCSQPLFNIKHGGKFVTVPEEPTSTGAVPKRYHTACFKCTVCGEIFEEKEGGHAVFVRVEEGACHVRCAPPEKITLRKNAQTGVAKSPSRIPLAANSTGNSSTQSNSHTAYYTSSSRYEPPAPSAPASRASVPSSSSQPRFGGSSTCPGCYKAVSPMERGVVPGPQGSKWHSGCLICGGLEAKGRRKEQGKAGCGKKLDSGAKIDADGGVWCRECLLLLPTHLRQASPVRSPIAASGTGARPFSMVASQATGMTLARQFTGLGGAAGDGDLLRQLTGGGLSPTRQLSSSPTKMYDGPKPGAGGAYPRPKSVTGTRSTGGGEGRGMFLVRQLTGGNTRFSGNEFGI